jgi:hypothetical protein
VRMFAPLPRAGFGQRRGGRSSRDGWHGRGSRPWWFGDGQAGCGCAAARSSARTSMHVLLSYCVVICCTSRVGVVRCDLVPPASYVVLGICCPYICDVYKSLTLVMPKSVPRTPPPFASARAPIPGFPVAVFYRGWTYGKLSASSTIPSADPRKNSQLPSRHGRSELWRSPWRTVRPCWSRERHVKM